MIVRTICVLLALGAFGSAGARDTWIDEDELVAQTLILAPDEWEPSVVVGQYGQGRCFAIVLGHDAKAMENDGFRILLTRGVEWAATGKVRGIGAETSERREPRPPESD